MATIKQEECGKEISGQASECSDHGNYDEGNGECGNVSIMFFGLLFSAGRDEEYEVYLFADDECIWKGKTGETAELFFDGETFVEIRYHHCLAHYACYGYIDPSESRKYIVFVRQGIFSTNLVLQTVEASDRD